VIAGEPTALDQQAIPAAVFTDPEIGTVGMTEEEAEADGFDPVVGEMPFNASGRAMTTGHTEGFVRLVADDETGFVLGAQIVGPEASGADRRGRARDRDGRDAGGRGGDGPHPPDARGGGNGGRGERPRTGDSHAESVGW